MDSTSSPILSCRNKRRNEIASPVLSKKRKTIRENDSDVEIIVPEENLADSPKIEHFSSPLTRKTACDEFTSPVLTVKRIIKSPTLKPRSLVIEFQDVEPDDSSPVDPRLIEEAHSDDELFPLTKSVLEDQWDPFVSSQMTSQMNSSESISQISSSAQSSELCSTPQRDLSTEMKKKTELLKLTESTRKKKQFVPNGLAKEMSRLIQRQESDYRLWKFQQRVLINQSSPSEESCKRLRVLNHSSTDVHVFAQCCSIDDPNDNMIVLLFSPERWERLCNPSSNDILCIYPPWQTMSMSDGSTLILGFYLMRKMLDPQRSSTGYPSK